MSHVWSEPPPQLDSAPWVVQYTQSEHPCAAGPVGCQGCEAMTRVPAL